MKDLTVVGFSPMFHWTEQKIRAHARYCVLARARLMAREAKNAGMVMSVRELLSKLKGIEENVMIYPSTGSRPRARRVHHRDGPHSGPPLRAVRPGRLRPHS